MAGVNAFDAAPMGHTIRLLQLPGSWTDFLAAGKVSRAQTSSLREIERTCFELNQIGIGGGYAVVNGVLPDAAGGEELAQAVRAREAAAIAAIPAAVAGLPRDVLELKPGNMVGILALESLFAATSGAGMTDDAAVVTEIEDARLAVLVDEVELDGHSLVVCMGKGGVGKTTVAAAIRGRGLDDNGRAALAEDLMSPYTEEVAVFRQFSRVVQESRRHFVAMDTAQTEVVLVTLAETTPVLEAEELKSDLERPGFTRGPGSSTTR